MRRFVLTLMLAGAAGPLAGQSVENGEEVFGNCAACHQVGPEAQNAVGPVLNGVVGRPAASYQGYGYSQALQQAGARGLIWDETTLFDWLAGPTRFLRDYLDAPAARSNMPFHLADPQARRDVIAYLATTEAAATIPPAPEMKDPTLGLEAASDEICIANASQKTHFFAAEGDQGARRTGTLAPGEKLCAPAAARGMVSAFKDTDAFEGCSRLVEAGRIERLRRYVSFDRCFWSSNM